LGEGKKVTGENFDGKPRERSYRRSLTIGSSAGVGRGGPREKTAFRGVHLSGEKECSGRQRALRGSFGHLGIAAQNGTLRKR